jgi:glycosyltransferase involved in cell wall biosynthesis
MKALERPRSGPAKRLTSLQVGSTSGQRNRGGLDRYFFELIHALPEHGIDVRGLVVGDPADPLEDASVTTFGAEDAPLARRALAARSAIGERLRDADLFVSHFAPYAFPVLDRIRKHPFIVHFHGPWALESAAEGAGAASTVVKRTIERLVYARGGRLIVLSRAFGAILEREYGVQHDRICIVPGGVDLSRFETNTSRHTAKEQLGWPTDRPIVLSVRRLVQAKGLENFIAAIQEVRKAIPDVLAIVAGTGPLASDLTRQVSELGLEACVRFTGFVPDDLLPIMYRAADLFVVPTVALEGFGLVVLEALASGTPVLVTPVAGLPEVVTDLDPGLIMAGSRAQDLALGMTDALSGRRRLPSDDECVRYARKFAWTAIAARVAEVYREVADSAR